MDRSCDPFIRILDDHHLGNCDVNNHFNRINRRMGLKRVTTKRQGTSGGSDWSSGSTKPSTSPNVRKIKIEPVDISCDMMSLDGYQSSTSYGSVPSDSDVDQMIKNPKPKRTRQKLDHLSQEEKTQRRKYVLVNRNVNE